MFFDYIKYLLVKVDEKIIQNLERQIQPLKGDSIKTWKSFQINSLSRKKHMYILRVSIFIQVHQYRKF